MRSLFIVHVLRDAVRRETAGEDCDWIENQERSQEKGRGPCPCQNSHIRNFCLQPINFTES